MTPLTFFVAFWTIWILISLTNPFGVYEVSDKTYLIIWLNMICFSIGYLLIKVPKKTNKGDENIQLKENIIKFLESKRVLLIQIIVLVTLLYYLQRYNALLNSMSVYDARMIVYQFGLLFKSPIETIYYNYFIKAILHISIIATLINFIIYGRKNITFFLSIINVVLFSLIGNGRMIYFVVLIYAILIIGFKYLLSSNRQVISVKRVSVYVLALFGIVFIMNYITMKRLVGSVSFFNVLFEESIRSLILYFTGGFRALDLFLTSGLSEQVGPLLGRASFSGLDVIVHRGLHTIYPYPLYDSANAILSFTHDRIYIGENVTFNAFYTGILNFYADFGIFGVLIFPTILGLITAWLYKINLVKPNLFNFAILIFITQITITYIYSWNFEQEFTWIVILILVYLANKKKYKFYRITL